MTEVEAVKQKTRYEANVKNNNQSQQQQQQQQQQQRDDKTSRS